MGSFITLDVVIGLVFMYLLLAIICSAITEWIASIFRLRSRTLKRALESLLDAPRSKEHPDGERLSDKVWNHELIRSLKQGRRGPSYIPAQRFAAALQALVGSELDADGPDDSNDVKNVRAQLRAFAPSLPPPPAVQVKDEQGADVVTISPPPKTRVTEEWFNETMDRATGWYRRKAMIITAAVAVLLTVLSNADTIAAARILWQNPSVRAAVVAQAEARSREARPPDVSDLPASAVRAAVLQVIQADYPDKDLPVSSASVAEAGQTSAEEARDDGDELGLASEAVDARGITPAEREALDQIIGWDRDIGAVNQSICLTRQRRINQACAGASAQTDSCREAIDDATQGGLCVHHLEGLRPTNQFNLRAALPTMIGTHFWGWFLTVTAVSMGAPFWFDLLKLLVAIRGSGKNPTEKKAGER